MSGIGDQTLNIAKGLKAISSNVTIGTTPSTLKSAFVKICKQKNTPDNKGISLRGNILSDSGKIEQVSSRLGKYVRIVHLHYMYDAILIKRFKNNMRKLN